MQMQLNVNGHTRPVEVEADAPLLWVIRDELNLTGTKFGCGVGACGACTVHVNGKPMRSCVLPVSAVADEDHDDRRDRRGGLERRTSRMDSASGAAMRLLPVGIHHGGERLIGQQSRAHGRGTRDGCDQHLPLRHVHADARRRQFVGRRGRRRSHLATAATSPTAAEGVRK